MGRLSLTYESSVKKERKKIEKKRVQAQRERSCNNEKGVTRSGHNFVLYRFKQLWWFGIHPRIDEEIAIKGSVVRIVLYV